MRVTPYNICYWMTFVFGAFTVIVASIHTGKQYIEKTSIMVEAFVTYMFVTFGYYFVIPYFWHKHAMLVVCKASIFALSWTILTVMKIVVYSRHIPKTRESNIPPVV